MIDIHSHILPCLDDGPQSLAAAVSMVTMAAQRGTTAIVATPHASSTFRYDPDAVREGAAELRALCDGQIGIYTGCELHLSVDNIRNALSQPSRYTINSGKYLLLELPGFGYPSGVDEVFRQLLANGTVPVISHPERNPFLQERPEQLQRWIEMNCLVQVTAQSLLGTFGRRCRKAAERLLREGLVHFVASDGHDTDQRAPVLDEAYRHVERHYGAEHAAALFLTNPRATLTGGTVTRLPKVAARALWSRRGT